MKFKIVPSFFDVQLESETDVRDYVLREMPAALRDAYLQSLSERMTVDDKGRVVSVRKYEGMQAELLARCLFLKQGDQLVPVEMKTIQTWPSSTVASLFEEAQKLNKLSRDEKESPLKNG